MIVNYTIMYPHIMHQIATSFSIYYIGVSKEVTLKLNNHNLLKFWNGIIQLPFLKLSIIILGVSSQQYRAWSGCTDVLAGLVLYWWQRLITFGSRRKRVNIKPLTLYSIHVDTCFYVCCSRWHLKLLWQGRQEQFLPLPQCFQSCPA